MGFPTPKELKKLADACRKAGISTFKQGEIEIHLSGEAPQSNYKKKQAKNYGPDKPLEEETLTEEQLLNWSVFSPPGEDKEEGINT